MSYDKTYIETNIVFGSKPEKILVDYVGMIDKSKSVLDIGAGQGRNSIYLAGEGFIIDAIDPSLVAVQTINKITKEKNYSITTTQSEFQFYNPTITYSAILVFGLIQILDHQSIKSLINKIESWTTTGSIVFITAFSTKDSSFQKCSKEWKAAGKNSFTNKDGDFRTFLEEDEVMTLFKDITVLHHWEGTGKKHKHGDCPVEQHAMIELVFQQN